MQVKNNFRLCQLAIWETIKRKPSMKDFGTLLHFSVPASSFRLVQVSAASVLGPPPNALIC